MAALSRMGENRLCCFSKFCLRLLRYSCNILDGCLKFILSLFPSVFLLIENCSQKLIEQKFHLSILCFASDMFVRGCGFKCFLEQTRFVCLAKLSGLHGQKEVCLPAHLSERLIINPTQSQNAPLHILSQTPQPQAAAPSSLKCDQGGAWDGHWGCPGKAWAGGGFDGRSPSFGFPLCHCAYLVAS